MGDVRSEWALGGKGLRSGLVRRGVRVVPGTGTQMTTKHLEQRPEGHETGTDLANVE